MREKTREKHIAEDTTGAIILLPEEIKKAPANTRIAMDMVQIFIDINEIEQAVSLFERLPESTRNSEMGKALNGQLTFSKLATRIDDTETLKRKIEADSNNYDVQFDLAIRLITLYQYSEAVDTLLNIQNENPAYKAGTAKELLATISNMLTPTDNELAKEIRRILANTISS